MKIARTENAARNIFFGVILRLYQILVPFLMRTAMIYLMGVQYLGLDSLFSSILQLLNLAELGVGSAMTFSMYKPIAEDDDETICALMKLYRTYYRVIGLVIAVSGLLITPLIPHLISGEIPEGINVYVLYLLNLAATVLSYWLFAYKNSILYAYQRVDVVSRVALVTNTVQYALQIFILWIFHDYYLFVFVSLLTQALTNIMVAYYANKLYPQYNPRGEVPGIERKVINNRIKDLFTSKIGGIIYDAADTIVISAFLGLASLAVYQNYFYILRAIAGLIAVVFSACTAGIGNSIVIEKEEKNFNDFKKLTFIICWLSGVCSSCLLCLYQPFMELWVGKDLMLPFSAVCCFVIYFFVRQLNSLFNTYKDASGMWHEDRFRPLAAAVTNLVLNLILVQFIGLYGILLSTVLAILLVGMPWLLRNLFTVIFRRRHLPVYIKNLLFYSVVVFISCVLTYYICSKINLNLILTLLSRLLIAAVLPNLIYLTAFHRTAEFRESVCLLNKITNGKLSIFLKEKDRN